MSEPEIEPAGHIAAIRQGLKAALIDIPGLKQCEAYAIVSPTPVSIDIYPGDPFNETRAFRNTFGAYFFTVRARTGTMNQENAQRVLDFLLEQTGPTSVKEALLADKTLGGACDSLKVEGPSGYQTFPSDPGGSEYLGATWQVEVLKST